VAVPALAGAGQGTQHVLTWLCRCRSALRASDLHLLEPVTTNAGRRLLFLPSDCCLLYAFDRHHRYGDDVEKEDDRSISELLVDQIEFADVILVNKIDLINAAQRRRITSLIANLNPEAKVLHTTNCAADIRKVINTGLFSMEKVRGSCCAGCCACPCVEAVVSCLVRVLQQLEVLMISHASACSGRLPAMHNARSASKLRPAR
jgi:hypothetical protein